MSKGIGGHHKPYRGNTDDWITPKEINAALGQFDLDPCASVTQPWPMASQHYTVEDDGLSRCWFGRVWLNPPYGPQTGRWLEMLARHNDGVALIFARTETRMFFDYVWNAATSVLFLEGRLVFYTPQWQKAQHNSGGPSVLVAYGDSNSASLGNCGIPGKFLRLK